LRKFQILKKKLTRIILYIRLFIELNPKCNVYLHFKSLQRKCNIKQNIYTLHMGFNLKSGKFNENNLITIEETTLIETFFLITMKFH